jgi:formylglycine-generating enzyme required for sulfatase activity
MKHRRNIYLFISIMILALILDIEKPLLLSKQVSTVANGKCDSGDCINGKGEFLWNTGDKYTGFFKNGKKHGTGFLLYKDGRRYSGQWSNDRIHGLGSYIWPNGNKYIGQFYNSRIEGKGTYIWKDGRKYIGQFKNGRRHGRGTLYLSNGAIYRTGQWEKNKYAGLHQVRLPAKRVGGMEFIHIRGGTFMMGAYSKGKEDDELPRHQVRVSSFWIGKYEVSQEQYSEIMNSNPSYFHGDNRPVEMVNWEDAMEFCVLFGNRYGVKARLPYEAEWEYACRAGTTTEFYWGDTIIDDFCWHRGNSAAGRRKAETRAVGRKLPNQWGLHDMIGNVMEWCMDWYGNSYYSRSPRSNPRGPKEGLFRILRGGDWQSVKKNLRSARRQKNPPVQAWSNTIGFRIVIK